MTPFHLYPVINKTTGTIKYKMIFEDMRFDTLTSLCNMDDEERKKALIQRLESDYARSDSVQTPSFVLDWMPFGRVRITKIENDGTIDPSNPCVIDIERKELLYLLRSFKTAVEEREKHDARIIRKGSVIDVNDNTIVLGKNFSAISEVLIRHVLTKGYDLVGLFKEYDMGTRKGIRQVAEYFCATGGMDNKLFLDDIESFLRVMNNHATFVTEKRRRVTIEDIDDWCVQRNCASFEDDYRVLYLIEHGKPCEKENIVILTAQSITPDEIKALIPETSPEWTENSWLYRTRKQAVIARKERLVDIRGRNWRK